MREIKFRAKDFTGGWQYGFVVFGNTTAIIIPKNDDGTVTMGIKFYVDRDTICQYTGLHDKKGQEIYDGDIVVIMRVHRVSHERVFVRHVVECDGAVNWEFRSLVSGVPALMMTGNKDLACYKFEVVGNIYDNPELAEEYSLNLPDSSQDEMDEINDDIKDLIEQR